jgi:hypothetical protein
MKARIAVMLLVLSGTLWPLQVVSASSLFYVGDIIIQSINITVDAAARATVSAVYQLTNRGSEDQEISLQFAQSAVALIAGGEELSGSVLFRQGETKSISLTCSLDITGETTKTLLLDPTMLFDGKPNSEPTGTLLMKVLLPEGINALAFASQEPDGEGFENGREVYSWSSADIYPTTLCLKWSALQVELSVEKNASPQEITSIGQIINLEIIVENNGDSVVDHIALVDLYMAPEFDGVEPRWEFGEEGTWLLWQRNIGLLEPGQSQKLTYSVRYVGSGSQNYDFDLRPCVVTVDGHLVSVSNRVRMSQNIKANPDQTDPVVPPESEAEPLRFPSLFEIGGTALILAIAGRWYVVRRRRHAKEDIH